VTMRVAHLVATFPPYYAGSGNACFYQAEALAARGHSVEVFTASYPGVVRDPAGVVVHRYGARLRIGNAPFIPQLALLDGFDVIHLHQPFIFGAEAALAASLRRRVPLVSSYHNELQAPGVKGLLFAGYDRTITRAALRRSARLTVLSLEHAREAPLLAAELARRPEAFAPVPNGVDVETFRPGTEPELRTSLGIPADATVAAFCAKLDAAHLTKRPDLAIEATARVDGLTLLVIGGGPLQERYESAAAAAGVADRVVFAGDQSHADVARHLRVADFLVMPSTLESFGIVQLEAMASGLPVVISDLPGARGVSRDGVHGVHVAPDDRDDLVRGLRTLMDADDRRDMGRRAREHVIEHYTWARCAELLEAVYGEIA
jgi:glycosyltransferase involved in cell wall biosynthesis